VTQHCALAVGVCCLPAGSRDCFAVASEYLSSFGVPVALITGNHGETGTAGVGGGGVTVSVVLQCSGAWL
jgi:hypothetical protein